MIFSHWITSSHTFSKFACQSLHQQCLHDYSHWKKTGVRHWRFEVTMLSLKYKRKCKKQWTKTPCFSLAWLNHVWISWWSLWDDVHFSLSILLGLALHSLPLPGHRLQRWPPRGLLQKLFFLWCFENFYWVLLSVHVCLSGPNILERFASYALQRGDYI